MVSKDKWNWKYVHGIHFLPHRRMHFLVPRHMAYVGSGHIEHQITVPKYHLLFNEPRLCGERSCVLGLEHGKPEVYCGRNSVDS